MKLWMSDFVIPMIIVIGIAGLILWSAMWSEEQLLPYREYCSSLNNENVTCNILGIERCVCEEKVYSNGFYDIDKYYHDIPEEVGT